MERATRGGYLRSRTRERSARLHSAVLQMRAQASQNVQRAGSSGWAVVLLTALTALIYVALLGWDSRRDVNPVTRELSGPYEPWQVIGVVVALASLVGIATWLRHTLAAIVVIPVVFTVCWSLGAARDPGVIGANLWPIGAALVAVGSLLGALLVAGVAYAVRSATSSEYL